ncbi:sensor histidine kinase [Chungangia koreensis]|uniref:histidine kinase n=1 Tax=Chungangia koreensis TaxID=752657 RepID=A0ABV8X750_9LACT
MIPFTERIINWAIRPLVFGLLWILVLLPIERDFLPSGLLLCALAFIFYFFIPVTTKPIVLYIAVSFTFLPIILEAGSEPIFLQLAFLLIDACFRLDSRNFKLYLLPIFGIAVLLSVFTSDVHTVSMLLLAGAGILAWSVNRDRNERVEYRRLYDGLLDEYRKLKREHSESDRVARLEERARIAHDIHDSVGHQLTALLMQLEMMSIEKQSEEYEGLKVMAKESLEETRKAVKTLKYELATGIESVIQLIRKLESDHSLSVKFTTRQGVLRTTLSNEQSVTLYRSIQEALTNAMKHGDTREVSVTIGRTALGELEWIVTNGLSRQTHFTEGFGLTAMRERVASVGGELRVLQTEKAFTVEGMMPIGGVKVGS